MRHISLGMQTVPCRLSNVGSAATIAAIAVYARPEFDPYATDERDTYSRTNHCLTIPVPGDTRIRGMASLRLDPGRRAIAALQVDWAIAAERRSNRKAYSNVMYAGYEERNAISVGTDGAFKKTVVDRFRDEAGRYEETQVVSGKIADDVVTGSITSRVRIVKPSA